MSKRSNSLATETVKVEVNHGPVTVKTETSRVVFTLDEITITAFIDSDGKATLKNDWADDTFHFRKIDPDVLHKVACVLEAIAKYTKTGGRT